MEEILKLTTKELYRGILKGLLTYPSINRLLIRQAAIEGNSCVGYIYIYIYI